MRTTGSFGPRHPKSSDHHAMCIAGSLTLLTRPELTAAASGQTDPPLRRCCLRLEKDESAGLNTKESAGGLAEPRRASLAHSAAGRASPAEQIRSIRREPAESGIHIDRGPTVRCAKGGFPRDFVPEEIPPRDFVLEVATCSSIPPTCGSPAEERGTGRRKRGERRADSH